MLIPLHLLLLVTLAPHIHFGIEVGEMPMASSATTRQLIQY